MPSHSGGKGSSKPSSALFLARLRANKKGIFQGEGFPRGRTRSAVFESNSKKTLVPLAKRCRIYGELCWRMAQFLFLILIESF